MDIDYKSQKKNAKKNKINERSSSQSQKMNYYQKDTKKKDRNKVNDNLSDNSLSSDDKKWVRGKMQNSNLFSDSENHQSSSSESGNEQPIPISKAIRNESKQSINKGSKKGDNKNEEKKNKVMTLPVFSSSESEDNSKKKKRKNNKRRKDVFSDSGESSSSGDDSDSSNDKPIEQTPKSAFEVFTQYISEPGYVSRAKGLIKKVLNERGSSNISIAFKGGKESNVLLHLVKSVIDEMKLSYDVIDIINFAPENGEIMELRTHINEFIKSLKMTKCLKVYKTDDLSEGLQEYVRKSNINTMMIGIKSSDEGAKSLQPTLQTQDIVQLNRVHPLLSWTYKDVWSYIDDNKLSVCNLYSQGYTKLNTCNNTTKNPVLSDKKSNMFKSAELLTDITKEEWSTLEMLEGKVLKGGQRGRLLLGVPTARVDVNPYNLEDGVYIGKAKVNEVDKKYRKSIISISSRIDITGKTKRTVAVYISHKYSMDFYGKYLTLQDIGLLRKQIQ